MSNKRVTASIGGASTFSESREIQGYFNFSLSGTWVATVFLQRSFDKGTTWLDVDSFTSNSEESGYEPENGVWYRFGVKSGGYSSGPVVGRISQ